MALFGRRRRSAPQDSGVPAETTSASATPDGEAPATQPGEAAEGEGDADASQADAADGATPVERGPWDAEAIPEAAQALPRVDLGALRIPARQGMALRMEVDRGTKRVIAANVTMRQSNIQLQAFAAPRSAGIWDEIRAQIASSIQGQGGAVQEANGPFGKELLALLPVRDPQGKVGRRPVRFLGVDGPRWFLRGVVTGAALVDPATAREMEVYFAHVVVARGGEPRPPSELLELRMPGRPAAPTVGEEGPPQEDILTRGPEISEVR